MLELYHGGLTACSIKSRLLLKEKGLPYLSRYVSLKRFEQHSPEILELNPNGLVPILVHDGRSIYESTVISEYVEDVFPERPLRPADPALRARMRLWNKLSDEALGPNMIVTFSGIGSIAKAAMALTGTALDERLSRVPQMDRKKVYEKVTRGGGFSAEEFAAAREKAASIVARAEASLADGPYLAGEAYSLADINMIPFIHRYKERIVPEAVTPDRAPRVSDWYRRVMARAAVIATFAQSEETRDPRDVGEQGAA